MCQRGAGIDPIRHVRKGSAAAVDLRSFARSAFSIACSISAHVQSDATHLFLDALFSGRLGDSGLTYVIGAEELLQAGRTFLESSQPGHKTLR